VFALSIGNKGGRPRKVVALSTGVVRKDVKLQRQIQESKIKIDRAELESNIPEWLTDEAREEYCRVVREAGKVPFLDNLDLHFVAMYADAYHRYIEAAKQLNKSGVVIETEKGPQPSPFISVLKKAEDTIFKCSSRLGLATTDRLRLIVPTKAEERKENKFLKYLKA
jgi:P27 family predicted phage terminase small subunit